MDVCIVSVDGDCGVGEGLITVPDVVAGANGEGATALDGLRD